MPFELFGTAHITGVLLIFALAAMSYPAAGYLRDTAAERTVAWLLTCLIVVYQISSYAWRVKYGGVPWVQDLPLHLCDINTVVCALMLLTRSYRLYEVAYFWSICGSLAALLTPDLRYGFPHITFLLFFFGHGVVIIAVLYATFAWGFRPQLRSVGTTLLITIVYGALLLPLNFVLDTNYMYLRAKPASATPIDYLGPWPWYLFGLVVLAAIVMLLSYAPFALSRIGNKPGVYNGR
jgi:hypothetical integral membrane protein (TIGR02206 family)